MEDSFLLSQIQCLLRSSNGGWHARAIDCGSYAWAENCEDAMRAAIALKSKPVKVASTTTLASSERKQRTLLI